MKHLLTGRLGRKENEMNFEADDYIRETAWSKRSESVAIGRSGGRRRAGLTTLPTMEELRQEKFITESRKMRQVFKFIERIAQVSDVTVLIEGET